MDIERLTVRYYPTAVLLYYPTAVLLYAYMLILCENLQILNAVCDIANCIANDSPHASNEVSSLY
jgi:hypothetical protein